MIDTFQTLFIAICKKIYVFGIHVRIYVRAFTVYIRMGKKIFKLNVTNIVETEAVAYNVRMRVFE